MVSRKVTSIIAKNLANSCSSDELSELGHWMDSSDRNRNVYYQYQLVWKYTAAVAPEHSFNHKAAWQKLQERINSFEKQPAVFSPAHSRKQVLPVLLRIAAVLIIALVGWYFLKPESETDQETHTLIAETVYDEPLVLPDGTSITLNAASQITYNSGFNNTHRNVEFEGEAFFDVVANATKPFVISTSNLQIRVLGTSFNLLALPDQNDVILYLKSGKVQVNSLSPDGEILEQILIHEGEKAVFNKKESLLHKEIIENQNYLAWKTGVLEFNNAPLHEVLTVLNKTYQFNFVLEHNCSNLLLTARFENETPESIFQTLELVFDLDITRQEDTILIR